MKVLNQILCAVVFCSFVTANQNAASYPQGYVAKARNKQTFLSKRIPRISPVRQQESTCKETKQQRRQFCEDSYCETQQCIKGIPSCLDRRNGFSSNSTDYNNVRTYQTSDESVFELEQKAPEYATVGQPYPIQITVSAKQDCDDIVVSQQLPCDAEFLKSDPRASSDGDNRLTWRFSHMNKGESRTINLWIRPMKEGSCLAAATVLASRKVTAFTFCGQPNLICCLRGPESSCVDHLVPYVLEVHNKGTAPARDVVVEDFVPAGLSHVSGSRNLKFQLGDISPGESKVLNIDLMAIQGGPNKNLVNISFENGQSLACSAETWINIPCLEVVQSCPETSLVGKPTNYRITVTNNGDVALKDVVLDDMGPECAEILSAPGAKVWSNRAIWTIRELDPGETRTFMLALRVDAAGAWNNTITATSQCDYGPFSISDECHTVWDGIPSTHMCVVDTQDPLCVGDVTVYHVAITNRGTASDTNVQVTLRFSSELQPESINGPTRGSVGRSSVTFTPLPCLGAKETVEYRVSVRGVQCGAGKVEAILTSDTITAPTTVSETTRVY